MSIFGKWGYKRLGGKKGLTLIELLIVLVILAILAGVIVLAVGGIFGRTGEQAYNLVRDELQLATTGYLTNSSHGSPVYGANNSIAICSLLGPDELLREIPDGVVQANYYAINGSTCGTAPDGQSYDWRLDIHGNVLSVCVAADCGTVGGAGYQDVWP
jgi:prepilin-type N-terminal cleavage/methylation domain-containing protein